MLWSKKNIGGFHVGISIERISSPVVNAERYLRTERSHSVMPSPLHLAHKLNLLSHRFFSVKTKPDSFNDMFKKFQDEGKHLEAENLFLETKKAGKKVHLDSFTYHSLIQSFGKRGEFSL